MNNCPCCDHPLLRHICGHEVYWFCRSCWQSMPVMKEDKNSLSQNKFWENLLYSPHLTVNRQKATVLR
ncbi:MAG: hypothetical protein VKL59_24560 [Nostocaceae cyanobacterium]|nr:hypothetical protein [Nostocaceae cyanobacterium]